eukprot:TRINITY_DN5705_c0_g2_i2.p1 TRINITY_DN5705_c0_g2~~TRINITY_DN5705_c0_g2_i2.p1  ORF type:complete len:332 (-),score=62.45 TRINITY_DN5705_c0_g2_i2:273-1157(-)
MCHSTLQARTIFSGRLVCLSRFRVRTTRKMMRVKAQEGNKEMDMEQYQQMQAKYEEMMKDPQTAEKMKKVEEMFKDPKAMQAQQEMMAAMQSKEMQQKVQDLRSDPELADLFAELEKKGPQAIFQYWNNPEMLQKISEKMGDVSQMISQNGAQAAAAPQAPPPPEVNDLFDAAKFGDLEAIEDFAAVGKDVNIKDKEDRTPLHYAIAYNHPKAVESLIAAGANVNAVDNKSNTPLHYACGYARRIIIGLLLTQSPALDARNDSGKTPFDLINDQPNNPINQDNNLMQQLSEYIQ